MYEPLHEANSICKAKISQKCAMRSRQNTHDFTVFGVVSTPYLPDVIDRGFFRPRLILWHRVLTISAKMEEILVSHQSTFPCEICSDTGRSRRPRHKSMGSWLLSFGASVFKIDWLIDLYLSILPKIRFQHRHLLGRTSTLGLWKN